MKKENLKTVVELLEDFESNTPEEKRDMSMKNELKSYAGYILTALFAAIAILGIQTFASPCPEGMMCKSTATLCALGFGLMILYSLVILVLSILLKKEKIYPFYKSVICYIVLDFYTLCTITTHGLCKMINMRCNLITKPFILAVIAAIAGFSIIYGIYDHASLLQINEEKSSIEKTEE